MSRDTYRKLNTLFKAGLGREQLLGGVYLPRPFETAISTMADAGLSTAIFQYITPLRRVAISDPAEVEDAGILGAYFGTRLEPTPTTRTTDWRALGWDGEPHMMLFPPIPSVWVILHEFGHYLDDTFIRAIHQFNFPDSRVDQFNELYEQMKEEFVRLQERGRNEVIKRRGMEVAFSTEWWWRIPEDFAIREAPTAYSYATFAEWFAECFQTHCIWNLCNSLPEKSPKTSAFLQFLLSGKIFRKSSQKVSYIPITGLALSEVASQG